MEPTARIGAATFLGAVLALLPVGVSAEVELPRESPAAKVVQQVGLTEIAVEYSSPAVKARRIWGGVVPYDETWSISPNQPTTIRFSRDVTIGDKTVPAGTYRLSAIPAKELWTFVLSKSASADGIAAGGDAKAETGRASIRFKVKPKAAPHRERLTFLFSDFNDDKAVLDLEWDKLRLSIPIATNTAQQVLLGINELDSAWRSYANAARFMLETEKDFDTGLKYANQSLALKEDWYTLWIKAALLAAKHDYKAAVEQGERAHELGRQQGEKFVLEPELKRALADWKKKL